MGSAGAVQLAFKLRGTIVYLKLGAWVAVVVDRVVAVVVDAPTLVDGLVVAVVKVVMVVVVVAANEVVIAFTSFPWFAQSVVPGGQFPLRLRKHVSLLSPLWSHGPVPLSAVHFPLQPVT